MLRRQFLMAASAAGVLAGCNMLPGGGGEVTVQDIITYIKDKCAFLADSKDIINVILTIVTGFNPSAGAAATVAVAVADRGPGGDDSRPGFPVESRAHARRNPPRLPGARP